jgi:hypothetical protein
VKTGMLCPESHTLSTRGRLVAAIRVTESLGPTAKIIALMADSRTDSDSIEELTRPTPRLSGVTQKKTKGSVEEVREPWC